MLQKAQINISCRYQSNHDMTPGAYYFPNNLLCALIRVLMRETQKGVWLLYPK